MRVAELQKLGPYTSMALLALPLMLIEPLKLVALFVAGKGRWLAGTWMIVAAYAGSLLIVERLFRAVKPKLMLISWFATVWIRFVGLRDKVICRGTANATRSGLPGSVTNLLRIGANRSLSRLPKHHRSGFFHLG